MLLPAELSRGFDNKLALLNVEMKEAARKLTELYKYKEVYLSDSTYNWETKRYEYTAHPEPVLAIQFFIQNHSLFLSYKSKTKKGAWGTRNLVTYAERIVILHKPSEWEKITGITILDPDGWREDNKSFEDPISEYEWDWRMSLSTIQASQGALKKYMRLEDANS